MGISDNHQSMKITDDTSFKVSQNIDTLQQYLMQKSNIIQKLKSTFLFPYLLNMEYLVGTIENVKITDDPIDELSPYLNTINGINKILQVNFNRENLTDWEVFRFVHHITNDENPMNIINTQLNIYILLKFKNNSLDLLMFGIIEGRVLKQDKVAVFLDNDIQIQETKRDLGLI